MQKTIKKIKSKPNYNQQWYSQQDNKKVLQRIFNK